jgi:hypothetical protein
MQSPLTRPSRLLTVALSCCLLFVLGTVLAQVAAKKTSPRARLPKFDEAPARGPFFENVFDKLEGPRIVNDVPATGGNTGPQNPTGGGDGGGIAGSGWDKLITAESIEDEIKAIRLSVDMDVDKPGDFRGRGYKRARKHFSMLAVLFAVIGEYDGDVRFQKQAPVARDLFSRAARNCKVGSTAAYNEAKLRKADLQDLVSGSEIQAEGTFDPVAKWGDIVDRTPIMQRLEVAAQQRLQQLTSNEGDFKAQSSLIMREAELVAVIGEVLCKDGMEDGDDDTYAGFAQQMRDAARDVIDAVKLENADAARKAVGEISKACSECHENYRG